MGFSPFFRETDQATELSTEIAFPQDDTVGLKEILVTIALFVVGYIVLATPIRSAFASFHPIDFLRALPELRHVRSRADAKLWWNQWKHDTIEREQQKRWQTLLRSGSDADRTIRASNGNPRSLPHLKSLFQPNRLHNSTSVGCLAQSPDRNGDFISEEEFRDTDHDRFERAWTSYIHNAEYKRLVLPPECKLVDSNWREKNESKTSISESSWQRMVAYVQNLYGVWVKLFSIEGFKGLLLWVMDVIRYKLRKRRGLPLDEDDEEDDDGSIVTLGTPKSSMNVKRGVHTASIGIEARPSNDGGKTPRIQGSNKKNENDPSMMNIPSLKPKEKEEKSSCLYPRKHSDTGDDDTFMSAAGIDLSDRAVSQQSSDIPLTVISKRSNKLVSPLPALAFNKPQQFLKKKKDALENYRQQTPAPLPISSPKAQVQEGGISPIPSPRVKRSTTETIDMNFFDTAHSNRELRDLSRAVPIPDSNGFILGDEFISASCTPLLVFVNSRSGPQQGNFLIAQFKRLLNPIQVWDLAKCSPLKILKSFSALSRVQVLVCGGDGTVSWIIGVLEEMNLPRWPPIAILPLGTGNDLARIHGWGGGYNNESLLYILRQISQAYISMLDLWELNIADRKGRQKDKKSFINYLGVGVDAQAALQVHNLRESTPKLFFSRFYNKVWYALAGGEEAIKSSCANLPQHITLVADGVEIPLPPDSQGIIFLNIDSYSGGVPLWSKGQKLHKRKLRSHSEGDFQKGVGTKGFARSDSIEDILSLGHDSSRLSRDERLTKVTACDLPSSCQDGLLDVVSIRGTFHLGQIRVGLSNAELLCQCRAATVTMKKKLAVQVDGEPWRQNQSVLQINRKSVRAVSYAI